MLYIQERRYQNNEFQVATVFPLYIALWWHSVWDKGWTRRKNNLSILLLGFFCATIIFFFFNIHTFHGIKTSIQVSHLCIVFKYSEAQWGHRSMGTLRDYGIKEREWEKFTALDSRRADGFQCTNSWEGHHSSICFDRDKTALQHFPSLNVFSCDCIYIMASYQQNSTLSSIKLFHWVWSTTALARLHPQSPSLSQCRSFSLSLSPLYFLWCIDLKKYSFIVLCWQFAANIMTR